MVKAVLMGSPDEVGSLRPESDLMVSVCVDAERCWMGPWLRS